MKLPPNFSILFSWRAINRSKPARALLLTLTLWAAAFTPAQAQFRIPGLKLPDIPGVKIPGLPELNIPGPETLFKEEEPVTTSIKDVRGEVPYLDAYAPKRFRPLSSLRRGPNGGWLLQPGLYSGDIRTYCLHAGTYGPTRGSVTFGIFKDSCGELWLFQQGRGPADEGEMWAMFNYATAQDLWESMADNLAAALRDHH